jgi:manganese/zinc/iron transport system permease protein
MSAASQSLIPVATRTTGRELIWLAAYLFVAGAAAAAILMRLTEPPRGVSRDLAAPLWTMAVGIVANSSCAILGCFLVLRRMSLLGDAISHAVLPGIAVAFYFSGSVSGWPIFIGAMLLGVLTSALTQAVSSLARVSEDTSLGVVFTSLFALGVIMLQAWARNADLDADCVFYGQIDYVAADTVAFLGTEISRPLLTLAPTLLGTVLFVALFWKELKIVAFDPALAAAMGLRVTVIHYLFMAMVAAVSVASFESVGAILVVAMLIVPPATALLMSERIVGVISWAVAFGATSAVFGYLLAMAINTSVAGAMAVVAGMQLAVAVFAAPRAGLVSRWLRNKSLSIRIAAEDLLTRLYRAEEQPGSRRPMPSQRGVIPVLARWRLARAGWVHDGSAGSLALTNTGRRAAAGLIRAHRLWETYLDTHFDLPRDHLHDAAERMEHFLGPELQNELAAELADRALDPHGKEITAAQDRNA